MIQLKLHIGQRREQADALKATGGSCPLCGRVIGVHVVRPPGKRKGWIVRCESCLSRGALGRDPEPKPEPVPPPDPVKVYVLAQGFSSADHGSWPRGSRLRGDHPAVVAYPQWWRADGEPGV